MTELAPAYAAPAPAAPALAPAPAAPTPDAPKPLATYDVATRESILTLRTLIDTCPPGKLVFFSGAGVSTESGIPDYRSAGGLYAETHGTSPETILSHRYFAAHPDRFFAFYTTRMVRRHARPNAAHRKLAQLERAGTLRAVITQNIDGLHQAAGSTNVLELHGRAARNFCTRCAQEYSLDRLLDACKAAKDGVPRCTHGDCNGIINRDPRPKTTPPTSASAPTSTTSQTGNAPPPPRLRLPPPPRKKFACEQGKSHLFAQKRVRGGTICALLVF